MKQSLLSIALSVLMPTSGVGIAANPQLEDTLNQQYQGRTYTLRQPMTAPTQQYDSQGNSPTASAIGPWTIYARVQIKKIKLEPPGVILEGQRIGMKFDPAAQTLVPVPLKDTLRLEISVNPPLDSAEQFHSVLGRIFAFTKEDFLASVPEFWRKYLGDYMDSYVDDGTKITFRSSLPVKSAPENQRKLPSGMNRTGIGVTAPRPTYTPDPGYSDQGRKNQLSGTAIFTVIVGADGAIHHIEVARPLGLGLDEKAERTIKTWRFEPAKRNGQPVAVSVRLEVAFQLGL